jgi:dethiobiotin synthetase
MKRYFIIGTDTDCGKTYVTCQLIDYFKKKYKRVIGLKPLASGCNEMGGRLVSGDVEQLQAHNGHDQLICGWQFKPPISPHLAAQQAGKLILAKDIINFCEGESFKGFDYVFIEGAGGLMAPLNEDETWVDVLKQSKIPAILVVGMRLGCLNHALLTELALKANHIECAGWIANCIDPKMLALEENIKTLERKIKAPLLARIPHGGAIALLQHSSL